MSKSLYKHISKEDKKRHFSNELWGGKGDCRFRGRRSNDEVSEELDNYRKNYDLIDWSKK